MKIKSLFSAVVAFALGAMTLVSCGGDGPTGGVGSEIYHYGNCKRSNVHEDFIGMKEGVHDYGTATFIAVDKISEVGTHIVGYRVFIGGDNPTNTSIFLGEDYMNPTYTQDFTYKKGGWNVVMLNEPMEIPSKDFYVGYKITAAGFPLAYEDGKKTETEMIYVDGEWDTFSSVWRAGGFWSIQLLVSGGDYSAFVQKDLVLENVVSVESCREGETFNLTAEVRNQGVFTAKGAKVTASFGGKTFDVKIEDLVHGQSALVEINNIAAPKTGGANKLSMELLWVDDEDNIKNNKVEKTIMVYPADAPARKAVLLEQFTGQDCPNCPAGAKRLADAIAGLSPEDQQKVIWVAHHTYGVDAFTINESTTIGKSLGVNFAPALIADRHSVDYGAGVAELVWHPVNSTTAILKGLIGVPALATIDMTRTFDPATGELTITVSGELLSENQYITALVKQSGMEARQSGGSNSYEHNNAPRLFLTAAKGNKLEADGDGKYSVTLTKTVPAKVGNFDTDPSQMEVVAFVHGPIGTASARIVANAIELPLLDAPAAVPAIERYNEMINAFISDNDNARISLSTDRLKVSQF